MPWMTLCPVRSPRAATLLPLLLVAALAGCNSLLEVDDPTAILENELESAQGAALLRRDVLRVLYDATDESVRESGLLADEFIYQRPASATPGSRAEELLDMRASVEFEALSFSRYESWQELWGRRSAAALTKLQVYGPPAHAGEVLAIRGYAAMRLGEHFCPGFPLHTVEDFKLTYGPPLTTEQAFEKALASFAAAVAAAVDSARVLNFARVGRARTLLNLGRFAEAGTAAADVPTEYVYQTQYNTSTGPSNDALSSESTPFTSWGPEYSIANQEAGTGLDFISASDPRVVALRRGTARDGVTGMYALGKYPNRTAPIVLASGIEARLIQAEAALRANQPQWLTLLNELRAAHPDTTLSNHPLADPGTDAARVDLLFRERAFWLFATGNRLSDLRRLVRQYGRQAEAVFPTGTYWMGGNYGPGTSIPLHKDEPARSPGVTGCTSR